MNFLIHLLIILIPLHSYCQNDAYELLNKAQLSKSDPDKALELLAMAQKLFLMSGNKNGLLEVENLKITIYIIKGHKQNTYLALKELEKLSTELNNVQKKLVSYKNLFEFFIDLEMYDSALVYNEKIKYLGEKHGLSEDITNVNGYLGGFYSKLKKYDTAKEYFLKSLKLKADKNKTSLFSDLGNTYYYLQNYDSAFYYYNLANEQAKKFQDTLGIAYTLNNIGLYYKAKRNYEQALNLFNESIYYYEILNNRYGIINTNSNIAQVLFLQNQYQDAINIASQYLQEAKENERFELVSELSKVLAESYENLKNFEKCVTYYKEYIASKDTLFQSKFKMLNSDYDYKFRILESDKKDEIDDDSFNYWIIICVISILINVIIVLFVYVLYKKNPDIWSNFFKS